MSNKNWRPVYPVKVWHGVIAVGTGLDGARLGDASGHATGITMTQRKFGLGCWWPIILAAVLVCGLRAGAAENESEWIKNSLASPGDSARLEQVMAKARRGESVTVGVIGGSITQGAKASKPENRYANLVAAWWRKTFPHSKIKFINAGIGATGSNYGALRARRDLLAYNPDFVVVDFAVNDSLALKQAAAETLEGLIRQILSQTNQPAVVLLFMMRNDGTNIQEWHGKVGAHYGLPMVSYRDALWPQIQAGHLKWEAVGADYIHPNDHGHAFAASCIISLLENTLHGLPADPLLPAIKPMPAPLFSDLFEHTALFEGEALHPVSNQGWTYDTKSKGWTSEQPGSVIEFELEGRVFYSMHHVVRSDMGKARVTVDGVAGKELNGWFDQTWGGYRQSNEILRQPHSGKHRVRFELLPDNSPGSTGHRFVILGLGAAGVPEH
ncbi:MAG: SGNH/GDSL hydrolase family protein [Verrucomicrobiales bacterium]|nr:SGNH/GDSL hydrolase family protein [Verrucomicrobiales bacterium]